jgi:hypothetical protein
MTDPKTRQELGAETISKFFENLSKLGDPLPQLWADALGYVREGKKAIGRDEIIAQGFLRVSVFMAAAAFEGFVNYLAEKVVQAGEIDGIKLSQFEVDCLRERRRVLEDGEVKEKRQIYSTKERFLLLRKKLGHGHGLPPEYEARLDASIKVRDMLVHPKPGNLFPLDERTAMGFFAAAIWLSETWGGRELIRASGTALDRS